MRIAISNYTATSCLGSGIASIHRSIESRDSGLCRNDLPNCDLDTWIGRVASLESVTLPKNLAPLESRNNRLTWLGLQQDGMLARIQSLIDQIGVERIGVVMATSTSSIGRTEEGYTRLDESGLFPPDYDQPGVHNLHSPGLFVAAATGLTGPSLTISTACSSSAKVFATAARWIGFGLVDAVLVGGIDSLCLSILHGFNALELLSAKPCRPFDAERDGINIGEAAGFALLVRKDLAPEAEFELLGYGESSDAHHMSHPHPEGKGAVLAMQKSLKRADLQASSIEYVNLHGTASKVNDRVESDALSQLFNDRTLASSTKGWTGHTLGAAGMMEAVITFEAMGLGVAPGTLNSEEIDENLPYPVSAENTAATISHALSNSFGFGGSNATLAFGVGND